MTSKFRELQRKYALKLRIEGHPYLKEFFGELVGTAILLIFGNGVLAQVLLGDGNRWSHGNFISVSLGWGMAVSMGVYYAGKSGKGHINPAVTLAMAITGKINFIRVPIYWCAQYLGAFFGSLIVFGLYSEKIYEYAKLHDNGTLLVHTTGNIFVTNPHASLITCLFDQIFGTALLCGGAYAITDKHSFNLPDWSHPIALGLMVYTIVGCFALNAGAALNPARDFGPRVMLAICGWGTNAFSSGNWFFWVAIIGPHLGAIFGAVAYELTVGIHLPGAACAQIEGHSNKQCGDGPHEMDKMVQFTEEKNA